VSSRFATTVPSLSPPQDPRWKPLALAGLRRRFGAAFLLGGVALGRVGVPGSVLACSWRWLLEKVTAVWCWVARPVLLICASPPSAWLPTAGRRPRLGEGGRAPLCIRNLVWLAFKPTLQAPTFPLLILVVLLWSSSFQLQSSACSSWFLGGNASWSSGVFAAAATSVTSAGVQFAALDAQGSLKDLSR
jgi:hypothetical protein